MRDDMCKSWFRVNGISGSVESPAFGIRTNNPLIDCFVRQFPFGGIKALSQAMEATLDSALSLVTFRTLDLPTMLNLAASALQGGERIRHHRKVAYASGIDQATVAGYGPIPYQVDGDYLGEAERLELSCQPNALTLILP